jgi:hypothetical protein
MAFFNPQPVNAGNVAFLIAKVCNQGGVTGQVARLHRIIATNTNAAQRFIQVFDSATLPADGAVPLITFPLGPGASTQPPIDFGVYGRTFQNGIVICNSVATEATKTLGAADSFFDLLVS